MMQKKGIPGDLISYSLEELHTSLHSRVERGKLIEVQVVSGIVQIHIVKN